MSLADYPNQFTVFCNNSCTKLMADIRIWRIKEVADYREFTVFGGVLVLEGSNVEMSIQGI